MTVLAEEIGPLTEGVRLRVLGDDVVNIIAERRRLEREDVTALRAALDGAGYEEVESWIATEGASWLSSGVGSVSIRYRRKA